MKKVVIGGYEEILVEYQPATSGGIIGGGIRVTGRGGSVLLSRVALQAIVAAVEWLEVKPPEGMRNVIGNRMAVQVGLFEMAQGSQVYPTSNSE